MNRKTIIYSQIVIALLLWSFPFESLKAQSTGIGVTGSYSAVSHLNNFRFVRGNTSLDFSPAFASGFNAGLMYRTNLSRHIRFQVEPSITMMGASYNESFRYQGYEFQTDSRTNLTYAHLPLLIQITSAPPDRNVYGIPFTETTYHFTGGLFGGYLLNAQFSGTNSGAPEGIDFQGDFSDNLTNQYFDFDAGAIIGGGVETGHTTKVGFETRFMLGVISPDNPDHITFDPSNMAITVGAYVIF